MGKQLEEILVMRPILICVLLIGYHAFAPWGGVWNMPQSIAGETVEAYFWLDKFFYSFMLEAFTFISGYLFAFQLVSLKKNYTLWGLICNKLKRLIVPSLVFSVLYSFLSYNWNKNLLNYIYDVICGLGHLWFLPMLFWCFIFVWLIEKLSISKWVKLFVLLIVSIVFYGYEQILPFRLGYSLYYLFYFYLAFCVFQHKDRIVVRLAHNKSIIILLLLFIISFVVFTIMPDWINKIDNGTLAFYIFRGGLGHVSRTIYSTLGLMTFYLLVMKCLCQGNKPSNLLIWLNPLCMGIYIVHNFVIRAMYDISNLPELLGTFWLPWVGYCVALISSIIVSFIMRRTRIGKILIG